MRNPYIPVPVVIDDITVENEAGDIKTFQLVFENEEDQTRFNYIPGQFAELSIFGKGESPIGIASSPTEKGYLLFSVKRMGTVTKNLHSSSVGRRIGIRGPFGKPFPWDMMEGKEIFIIGGGFAFSTLRSSIVYMLAPGNREKYGKITVVYGSRDPGEFLYKELIGSWENEESVAVTLTVDRDPTGKWDKKVGLIPNIVTELEPNPDNTITLVCGPPIMIKFTVAALLKFGFEKDKIILSLENRMKCGIGKCGRCNIGSKYVCLDGPVFTCQEYEALQG